MDDRLEPIRRELRRPRIGSFPLFRGEDLQWLVGQLDSARARNAKLEEALIAMRKLASVSTEGDPWYAEHEGLDADAIFALARSALVSEAEVEQ